MGNTTQNLTFKGTFDVKDVMQGIDQIKKNLGSLSLGPGVESEFNKLFQKIERNAEKANNAMATGFKNKGDVKAYEDAMRQISTGYDDIITKAKVLSNSKKINLQVDDAAIKSLNSEMEALRNNITQAKDSLKTLKASTGRDMGDIAKKYKGGASSWNDAVRAFKDGDIQKTDNAIKVLENTIKVAQTKAQKSSKELGGDWPQKIKDIEALRQAFEDYRDAQNDIKTSETELAQKEKELNNIMAKGSTLLIQTADVGEQGAQAFRDYARESVDAAKGTQQLNSELDHFKGKAAYFFGISNAINLFKRAVRSAYDTVKDLDAVMTETAVVTNFDVGDMWSQLPEYTQRANELGVTIHDTYEAATLFYQQGLKTNQVMEISNETLKMARIAGLDAATASDRMTNALRGFNMELDKTNAQRVNDVYSKLAAITASNTDEISTAMTKVASLAHNANMEFETTAAFLAQMIETTRESAETAGTALKTVVARFSEVKKLYSKGELMGSDEEGEEIDVNKVSTALRSAGINLNEYLTGAKGLDDIFIELADKWDSLDQVQQRYIATMAAGSRQQSRFIALMSNSKRTTELVEAANNANGASQEQYAKTLESLQTKLARLKNAWNEFILGLANSDVIKTAVDMLTNLITAINDLIKAVSGKNAGAKMVVTFFTAFTTFKAGKKLFSGTKAGKFFGGLTEAAGLAGEKSVAAFVKRFYGDLSKKIADAQGGGLRNEIQDIYGGLSQYFAKAPRSVNIARGTTREGALTNLVNKFGPDTKNEQIEMFRDHVGKGLKDGTLTIDQLNASLDHAGQTFKVTEKNAKDFGLAIEDNSKSINNGTADLRRFSAGAVVAGGIMVAVGNTLEQTEGPFQKLGTVLKVAGSALLTFGTIMSVYLPLQAQLMAKGVTGAIVSIPIIGWIAGIIAALVALGTAIHSFVKNYSFEAKMEKANAACKNAADAADEATKAYEKLGQAWDSLNDKYAAIDNAVTGTKEWKEAIKDANNEVLSLVESYEGLQTRIGEDGRLEITEESKDAVKNKLGKTQEYAQAASIGAQLARNEVRDEKAKQGYDSWNVLGGYIDSKWKGSDGNEYTEDKVREEIVQAIRSGEVQSKADLIKLVKTMTPEDRHTVGEGENAYDFYDKQITDYVFNGMKEYAETSQFSEASQAQFNGLISNALTHVNDKDAVKLGKNLITTGTTEALYKKVLEDTKTKDKDWKQETLAKRAGYDTYEEWKQKANNGQDISEKELDRQIATQETQDRLNNFATQFETKIGNLTEAQLKYLQQEGGGALTADEIKQIKDLGGGEGFAKSLGDEEYFKNLGIVREQFIKEIDKNIESAEKYITVESGNIIAGLGEKITQNLTAGVGKSLTENFESVFTASGQKGVDELQKQIKAITKDMNPKESKAFADALSDVDWSSANSVHTLSDLAAEYGITDDRIKKLEDDIVKFNNASSKIDLSKLNEQLKSLLKIGKGIKTGTQGRSFGEDDYKKLTEQAGIDADKFVYNIETGEYDYTGVLDDILDAVNKLIDNSLDANQLEKDIASGKAAQEVIQNGKPETNEDKMAFIRDYVLKAGENSKISTDMLKLARDDAAKGNYITADKLIKIIENEKANLGEKEATLDKTRFDAEVMRAQMKSGVENAFGTAQGGEISSKALQAQLSSSGLTEKIKQELLSGIQGDNEEEKKKAATQAGHIVDTFAQAKANGISDEDLNAYADALQRVQGLQNKEKDELYAMALAEAKYNEGMKSLVSSYDDWSKLIDKKGGGFKIPQPDTAAFKVYTKMKEDVEKMLNSSEKIPDEFFKSAKNAELLKKAVKQDKKAAAELAGELAKVNIGDLGTKEDTNQAKDWVDQIQKSLPNLKIGATFDEDSVAVKLAKLLYDSGKTVDEVNKIMGNLGMGIQWEAKEVDVKSYTESHTGGTVTIPYQGGTKEIPVNDLQTYATDGKAQIMMPKKATFNKPPKLTPPKTTQKKKKGGGSKKKAKKERWENPYDELYNLQEKINESLRKREALERRYQKLLKQEQSQLSDIRKSYYDQIGQIRYEANLQKELEAGRLRQINNIGKETYVDSKGKVKTFDQMGVTKYAKYNKETGTIEIDWEGIQALEGTKNVEKGKAVEAYISKLEQLVNSYEEVRDKLWELEDKIEEYRQAVIDTFLSFEDRVMDALVSRYQKEIDNYQAMSDAIDKVNNEVISSLREQIDLSRQIRDNTKKEEDISKKENRLAYLQRDTSGANDLEILSLQKELKEARENYSDELIDQAIDKMQDDADKASEQRQRQIEIMQTQLDIAQKNGDLWDEVYGLMTDAAKSEIFSEDSELAKLLKDGEAFKALSNIGQKNWWAEVGKAFREAIIGRDEAEDKFQTDANNDGTVANTGTSAAINEIAESNTQANVEADKVTEHTDTEKYGVALAILTRKDYGGWGKAVGERKAHFKEKGFNAEEVEGIVNDLSKDRKAWNDAEAKKQKKAGKNKKGKYKYTKKAWAWQGKYFGISDTSSYTMSKFKTGGLADSTGPAWLDGTKTKPELVLNAQDTKNFITLKDILASLMGGQGAGPTTKGGDNYFDINISADIGSDYDVDRLASRIKKQIYEDGQYRNVNTINFLR